MVEPLPYISNIFLGPEVKGRTRPEVAGCGGKQHRQNSGKYNFVLDNFPNLSKSVHNLAAFGVGA